MDHREHILNILLGFWRTLPRLKTHTEAYLVKHKIRSQERRRIVASCNDIVRWIYFLEAWIEYASKRKITRIDEQLLTLLHLAVYELKLDPKVPDHAAIHSAVKLAQKRVGSYAKGYVNGVLRSIARLSREDLKKQLKPEEYLSTWYSFPDWLVKRWQQRFGDDAIETVLSAANQTAPLTARIHSGKVPPSDFLAFCEEQDISITPEPATNNFFRVNNNGYRLFQSEGFQKGFWSFQDRAAGMLAELLDPQPGDIILDACAAPGTKTFYLWELMQGAGQILANDIIPERVEQGKADNERQGADNIHWSCSDATSASFPTVDKILVDAPCTGTGVIRRRPDIKWRRDEASIPEMQTLQLAILSNICQYVKSGGILVYGTCSMEREENQDVIRIFLERHKDFSLDENLPEPLVRWKNTDGSVETFPHRDSLDGMFGVRLKRHD
ncbi:MAG: 16S rRNA (cytosine(967)-C(5))-methyltransferase RsmB [Fidelibacterota bacterium]